MLEWIRIQASIYAEFACARSKEVEPLTLNKTIDRLKTEPGNRVLQTIKEDDAPPPGLKEPRKRPIRDFT